MNEARELADRLIDLVKTAARLDVSKRGVYRLVQTRQLPHPVKVGRSSRWFESDVDEYLARLRLSRSET